ncbi:hypothetical protein ACHRV1_08730 [Flavobacterium aquidurense]|jgi:antitoxin component YwqK of YwqJK toxin-antitoxin module|uniref:hypothetical protein n=1 Tax=Flavobacterium aquidurense TaxID=362413 RepID=UPI00104054FB
MRNSPINKWSSGNGFYRSLQFLCILFSQMVFSGTLQITPKNNNAIKSKHLVKNYYPNGKIKEKGYQGYYENKDIATGTFIGTWYLYDQKGKIIQSVYYHNDVVSKAYIEKKKYYPNGKIKSIEKFNNYELYESEIDSIGTWQYFDQYGKLIKKVNH